MLFYVVCFITTREVVTRDVLRPGWKDSLATLRANRPLHLLCLAALCMLAAGLIAAVVVQLQLALAPLAALRRQLAITGDEDRLQYDWHQDLLAARMPQTIGGGIGQSRLAMLLLQKEHIGQVQVGVWPSEMKAAIPGML